MLPQYKLWGRVVEQIELQEMPCAARKRHPALVDPGPALVRRLSRTE